MYYGALDEALEFVHQAAVPSSWRTEVKDESSSSEEDDDDEEEQEEDTSAEEEGELGYGTPINKKPVLGYRNLDLFKLYRLVQKLGGFHDIDSGSVWKTVYQALGIPVLNSAAGYNVKCAYRKYLYGFEEYCTSCVITFRMDLPLKQPKAEGERGEATTVPPVASSSCGEEQKQKVSHTENPSAGSETSSAQPNIYKVSVSLSVSVQFKGFLGEWETPEWRSGLRHCISVLEASLQTLVRFQAVSQLPVIGSPIGHQLAQRHPGLAGISRHCK
ncbi:AT-rich interactive domain-containing protein 4B-like [Salvelinus sp. IW2-2015]|uniref:AT-rich interactive domain-containing protein 4B-like n=1 Tax=Salvelinus sp. IW2-2015 TaxID=2691554 RepID=UPI0038D48FA7